MVRDETDELRRVTLVGIERPWEWDADSDAARAAEAAEAPRRLLDEVAVVMDVVGDRTIRAHSPQRATV